MSRTNRYFACTNKYGGELYKQRPDGSKVSLLAKRQVYVINDIDVFEEEFGGRPFKEFVDIRYYVEKAGEIIGLFRGEQAELFELGEQPVRALPENVKTLLPNANQRKALGVASNSVEIL